MCVCILSAPFIQILDTKASSRTCHVVEDVFRCVGYGILANDGFTPQAILMFVHGLVSDAIPQLSTKPRLPPSSNDSMLLSRRPVDSRLIAKEPGRAKPKPATQANIAAHIVTEFGLQVHWCVYVKWAMRHGIVYVCTYETWSMCA